MKKLVVSLSLLVAVGAAFASTAAAGDPQNRINSDVAHLETGTVIVQVNVQCFGGDGLITVNVEQQNQFGLQTGQGFDVATCDGQSRRMGVSVGGLFELGRALVTATITSAAGTASETREIDVRLR